MGLGGLAVACAGGLAACGSPAGPGGARTAAQSAPVTASTVPAPPLTLVSASPASGTALATPSTPVELTFSSPLAAASAGAAAQVTPATAGHWSVQGATLTFTPTSQYAPYTALSLTVPAGLRSTGQSTLAAPVTVSYTTPTPSTLRVQQLLAQLDYLPLSWTPTGAAAPLVAGPTTTAAAPVASTTTTAPTGAAPSTTPPGAPTAAPTTATPTTTAPPPTAAPATATTPSAPVSAADVAVADQGGAFAWRWPTIPAGLGAAWAQGSSDLVTTGAVMAFEADHGLAVDGIAGPSVWSALTTAVAAGQLDPRPYDYISVSMARPESLTVWQAGADVYATPANTGVPGATTAPGTFPVYERFTTTTMSGRNPDGSTYHDPGIPWVAYFHGGDAIHGFVRPGYGYPQSDGCVELPPTHAQAVYPMDYYGTLVTVA